MMPASITGWISHALGLGGMFKWLGPEICSQAPYHIYFETCRILIIYAQLTLRLDSFLADRKWLTIPWLTRHDGKTPKEQICDVLAQLCRVQKYWDDVVRQEDQRKRDSFILKYQQQLALCSTELQNWASLHKATIEAQRHQVPYYAIGTILDDQGNRTPGSNRPALFEVIYGYPDLETAHLLCLYHAIYVYLTIFVHNPPSATFVGLYPPLAPPPPMDSPVFAKFLNSGLEIAKSTDFHLQEHLDSAGSLHLIFPMKMAARAFEEIQMREEEKWATGILAGISNSANRQWTFAGQIIRESGKDIHQLRQ